MGLRLSGVLMLNAAIYGLGRWGLRLVDSVQGSDKIRFVRGISRDPVARRDFTEKTGVPLTARYDEVLADRNVHAVVLATPHSQHHEQIVQAAAAGKHIFVEKPFTLTRASADRAVAACQKAGVTLAVGFNRRYAPAFLDLMRRLKLGEVGDVLHIEGQFSGGSGYQLKPGAWRASRLESPGGAMTARGVHALDAMIHIAGPVSGVFAFSDRHKLTVEVDDTTALMLRFAKGTTGYLSSLHATGEFWRVHVFGSAGWLEMRGDTELIRRGLEGPPVTLSFPAVDKERAELEAFAEAVAAKQAFLVPPAEAINGVAVLEAMSASAASGALVSIPA
jgi:predicted dehydrogenase